MPYKDKLEHGLISFLLAALVYGLTTNQLLTIFAVLLIGLLKEYYDQRRGKNTARQSLADLIADAIGIAAGILLVRYAALIFG